MEDSPTTSRSKRVKIDKSNRSAAFQKLKELKGSKNKYQIDKLDNVYDQVDEKEYSKTVADRQQSDWIVDDGESGYVEDGREIFDDDLDDESIQKASKQNLSGPRKRKRDDEFKSKGSIVNMFKNSEKKKKELVKPENENLLADILKEFKKNDNENNSSELNKKLTPTIVNKFKVTSKSSSSSSSLIIQHQDNNIIMDNYSKDMDKIKIKNNDIDDLSIFDNNCSSAEKKEETTVIKPSSSSSSLLCENNKNNKGIEIKDLVDDDDDEFDAIIGSIDEENLYIKDNRPKIEDDFDKFISTLNEKSLWSAWDGEDDDPIEENVLPSAVATTTTTTTTTTISSSNDINDLLKSSIFKNKNGDNVVRFYWWDAVENPYKNPGVVNLFGKIYIESSKSYLSCCLCVKNIPRRIYILPSEKIIDSETKIERLTTMQDVYNEFKNLADINKINEFRSLKTTKLYAFDRKNTPLQSEYLEVRYSPSYPILNSNYSGKAIEHIFGTSVNPLELLLIERKLKGPNWLDIKSPIFINNGSSWCKLQLNCLKMEDISISDCYDEKTGNENNKLKIPPMILMTINVRTTLNSRNNDTEITMISILINNNYNVDKPLPKIIYNKSYCLITHPKDKTWPLYARDKLQRIDKTNIIICETETDILEKFLDIINEIDPDLLLGYDCGFQFDIIYQRLIGLKIKNSSKISKLKQNLIGQFSNNNNYKLPISSIFSGRPICDVVTSVKELNLKIRSYDLDSICNVVLKTKENTIEEIKPSECSKFYDTADKIITLINVTMSEALYISKLIFQLNFIPLSLQITSIAGNILSRTLTSGRAERNEYLLLHAFSEKNYITPDKKINKKITKDNNNTIIITNKKPKYTGGLVLEPKRGFYNKYILLMDFNSLYPSIIQEYNLCFTTLPNICNIDDDFDNIDDLLKINSETGIIPTEIRKLVESRRQVKNLMKQNNLNNELKMNYNIRQLALKLTANSMYGCLGATHSRFYAKTFAALITYKGREILEHTKNLVENLKYQVIYGDTDSLMINSECLNYDKALDIGKNIKNEVNKHYKMLELDIDGIFKYLLLLKKKKYAAIIINKLQNGEFELIKEYKGIDIVRRDWCKFACDSGANILDLIFLDCTDEEKLIKIGEALNNISNNARNNKIPSSSFFLHKQLSRNPNDYPNKSIVHVAIALKMNKTGGRMFKSGDTISYIICNDGSINKYPIDRAYHIDEFKQNKSLSIDYDYYLFHQVYPVISRICSPIEMITDTFLIDNLYIRDAYIANSKSPYYTGPTITTPTPIILPKTFPIDYNKILNKINSKNKNKNNYEKNPFINCKPFKFKCIKCHMVTGIKDILYLFSHSGLKLSLCGCSNPICKFVPFKFPNFVYNSIHINLRQIIKQYYLQNFICRNSKCRKIQRKIFISGKKKLPMCIYCGRNYLKKTYITIEFLNQFNFYHYLFDITKIDEHDLPIAQSNHNEMIDVYKMSTQIIESYINRSSYSVINLQKILNIVTKKSYKKKKNSSITPNLFKLSDENFKNHDNSIFQKFLLKSKHDDFINKVVFW